MRRLALLSPFLLVLLVAPCAHATQETTTLEATVREYLRVGVEGVAAARKPSSPARKLVLADRALAKLHRAHALQKLHAKAVGKALGRSIEAALICGLNLKTRVYLQRGSLPRAKRLNDAALSLATVNIEALKLRVAIQKAMLVDVYEQIEGRQGIQRLRARHATAGSPLRNRGGARRR